MIQMQNLPAVHGRLEPQLSEAISRVVSSGVYIRGNEVRSLEDELARYIGVKYARTCGNGTDALTIALMALRLQPGDEVITTTFSFIAAAEACALLGLVPVFADIDPKTFNISPSEIERLISSRTRAIIPVHLFGCPADMESVMRIARRHKLYVIEDFAQAFGSETTYEGKRYRVGAIGTIGCTSFYPTKNLGCMGDGGAVFTQDEELSRRINMISTHGAEKKYQSTEIGLNSRLDEIQAAILRIKLRHIDQYVARRRGVALKYRAALAANDFVVCPQMTDGHTFNQFTIRVNYGCRDNLRAYLTARQIATMIYIPPIHRQKVFEAYNNISLPVADTAIGEVLSLPMHTELTDDEINEVCTRINEWQIGMK